jgi:hypothetical protein
MKAYERHTCGWKGWMIMTKKSYKNTSYLIMIWDFGQRA